MNSVESVLLWNKKFSKIYLFRAKWAKRRIQYKENIKRGANMTTGTSQAWSIVTRLKSITLSSSLVFFFGFSQVVRLSVQFGCKSVLQSGKGLLVCRIEYLTHSTVSSQIEVADIFKKHLDQPLNFNHLKIESISTIWKVRFSKIFVSQRHKNLTLNTQSFNVTRSISISSFKNINTGMWDSQLLNIPTAALSPFTSTPVPVASSVPPPL